MPKQFHSQAIPEHTRIQPLIMEKITKNHLASRPEILLLIIGLFGAEIYFFKVLSPPPYIFRNTALCKIMSKMCKPPASSRTHRYLTHKIGKIRKMP